MADLNEFLALLPESFIEENCKKRLANLPEVYDKISYELGFCQAAAFIISKLLKFIEDQNTNNE